MFDSQDRTMEDWLAEVPRIKLLLDTFYTVGQVAEHYGVPMQLMVNVMRTLKLKTKMQELRELENRRRHA